MDDLEYGYGELASRRLAALQADALAILLAALDAECITGDSKESARRVRADYVELRAAVRTLTGAVL